MKLLLDMNLSPRWASYLREHRFSVEHWSDVGRPDAEDQIIMAHARTQSAIVITSDLDFGAMLALSGDAGRTAWSTPKISRSRAWKTKAKASVKAVFGTPARKY